MTLHELARIAADAFETRTRDSGETFDVVRDGAPDWIGDLVRVAHGDDFLPDDWRYSAIRSALEYIADTDAGTRDDLYDAQHEYADGATDVYTWDRYKWLTSNLSRAGYVDEATDEYGPASGIVESIGRGQYAELCEVFGLVADALAERMDEDED